MKKVRIIVHGRVQGVGFRFMTKLVADELGITGLVRNEPDGTVYIEATGPTTSIDRFINKVQASPSPSAQVDYCDITEDDSLTIRKKFGVTYY